MILERSLRPPPVSVICSCNKLITHNNKGPNINHICLIPVQLCPDCVEGVAVDAEGQGVLQVEGEVLPPHKGVLAMLQKRF